MKDTVSVDMVIGVQLVNMSVLELHRIHVMVMEHVIRSLVSVAVKLVQMLLITASSVYMDGLEQTAQLPLLIHQI